MSSECRLMAHKVIQVLKSAAVSRIRLFEAFESEVRLEDGL
jgi:hypothetical protein